MAWFFTDENITSDTYVISGENARHISKSLRMKKGEELTLVTPTIRSANVYSQRLQPNILR